MNFLLQLAYLSNSGAYAFELILNNYNGKTGISIIPVMTQTDRCKFSKGYKELKDKYIVKRIRRQHYILNPDCLINMSIYDNLKALYAKTK